MMGNPLFSIYYATKCLLQKVWFVFYWKTADPLLHTAPGDEPLLVLSNDSILIDVNDEEKQHSCLVYRQNPASGPVGDSASADSILSIVNGEETPSLDPATLSDADNDEETHLCVVSCCQEWKEDEMDAVAEMRCSIELICENIKEEIDEAVWMEVSSKEKIVVVGEERWIKHYCSRHKILLVGEGDFSFSACLAVAFGSASNIIATSLNSKEFLKKNYGSASSNLKKLRDRGSKVMHGIDATELADHEYLGQLKFDRIVFNFPFAGFFHGLSTKCQLRRLVSLFLKNAREMMNDNGEIHISHKTNGNFHASFKLRLVEAIKFERGDYPGYNTKYGFGGDDNFNCNPSKTFKFAL